MTDAELLAAIIADLEDTFTVGPGEEWESGRAVLEYVLERRGGELFDEWPGLPSNPDRPIYTCRDITRPPLTLATLDAAMREAYAPALREQLNASVAFLPTTTRRAPWWRRWWRKLAR